MKKTSLLIGIFILVLAVAGIGQSFLSKQLQPQENGFTPTSSEVRTISTPETIETPQPTKKIQGDIKISIDFGNGKKLTENVDAQNAHEALEKLAQIQNFIIMSKEFKYGRIVEKIADTSNTTNKYWIYSVNGKPGQVAAEKYLVHPQDTVEWKYTKS